MVNTINHLTEIYFCRSSIGDSGNLFADLLSNSPMLKIFSVENCVDAYISYTEERVDFFETFCTAIGNHKTLDTLLFDHLKLDHKQTKDLVKALEKNTSLTKLKVEAQIYGEAFLFNFLKTNKTLLYFSIKRFEIYDELEEEYLKNLFNDTQNAIDNTLATNKTLQSFSYHFPSKCMYIDEKVENFSLGIQCNTGIKKLTIKLTNYFPKEDVKKLYCALKENKNLTSLKLYRYKKKFDPLLIDFIRNNKTLQKIHFTFAEEHLLSLVETLKENKESKIKKLRIQLRSSPESLKDFCNAMETEFSCNITELSHKTKKKTSHYINVNLLSRKNNEDKKRKLHLTDDESSQKKQKEEKQEESKEDTKSNVESKEFIQTQQPMETEKEKSKRLKKMFCHAISFFPSKSSFLLLSEAANEKHLASLYLLSLNDLASTTQEICIKKQAINFILFFKSKEVLSEDFSSLLPDNFTDYDRLLFPTNPEDAIYSLEIFEKIRPIALKHWRKAIKMFGF